MAAARAQERLNADAATAQRLSGDNKVIECDDPVVYFTDHLGVQPWSRQEEILRAAAAHDKTAVRSGHKIGKTTSAAGIALWWYQTRPRAFVILTSSSDDQVRLQLWPELQRLVRNAKRPIGGTLHTSHRTGLVASDGRRIVGIATNTTERMGGYSGAQLLFIVDESSGIGNSIIEAVEGNRAGGARLLALGNPTQTSGWYYDAFHEKQEYWHTLHVSSEEAADYQERVRPVPGLAMRSWVEEKRKEWHGPPQGIEPEKAAEWPCAPEWDVRVGGNFARSGENVVMGLALVAAAVKRGKTAQLGEEPLELGVDPARYGDDEAVILARRGKVALQPTALRSMDGFEIGGRVLELVRVLRRSPAERPRVKVDEIGVGASVVDFLSRQREVICIPVNVAEVATAEASSGEPGYERLRDQLWFAARDWLRAGGAISDDPKLHAELVAPTYKFTPTGDYRVESKDDIKKRLKRSPDRADALCLAVYNPPQIYVGAVDEDGWMDR